LSSIEGITIEAINSAIMIDLVPGNSLRFKIQSAYHDTIVPSMGLSNWTVTQFLNSLPNGNHDLWQSLLMTV